LSPTHRISSIGAYFKQRCVGHFVTARVENTGCDCTPGIQVV